MTMKNRAAVLGHVAQIAEACGQLPQWHLRVFAASCAQRVVSAFLQRYQSSPAHETLEAACDLMWTGLEVERMGRLDTKLMENRVIRLVPPHDEISYSGPTAEESHLDLVRMTVAYGLRSLAATETGMLKQEAAWAGQTEVELVHALAENAMEREMSTTEYSDSTVPDATVQRTMAAQLQDLTELTASQESDAFRDALRTRASKFMLE